jgi:drug/metabolite transporter (DMT)-like permease
MSRVFLIVRIILLIALLFLLAAVFWGIGHHAATEVKDNSEIYETYSGGRPAAYMPYLLVGLVVLGVFIVVGSIFFEFHQVRKGPQEPGPGSPRINIDYHSRETRRG